MPSTEVIRKVGGLLSTYALAFDWVGRGAGCSRFAADWALAALALASRASRLVPGSEGELRKQPPGLDRPREEVGCRPGEVDRLVHLVGRGEPPRHREVRCDGRPVLPHQDPVELRGRRVVLGPGRAAQRLARRWARSIW